MKTINVRVLAGLVAVVLAGTVMVGCENTQTTDTAINVGVQIVDPSGAVLYQNPVTLSGRSAVTLSAALASTNAILRLPLEWSVSDSTLGAIRGRAGVQATYESSGKVGNNTVLVRDQGAAEGILTIIQQ